MKNRLKIGKTNKGDFTKQVWRKCIKYRESMLIIDSDRYFIHIEPGGGQGIENFDEFAHGRALGGGNLDVGLRVLCENLAHGSRNFICCNHAPGESNLTIRREFEENIISVAGFAGDVFRAREVHFQHIYLALELGLDDEENEQDGEDIQHRHDGDTLHSMLALVDIHGQRRESEFVPLGEQIRKNFIDERGAAFKRALKAGKSDDPRHGDG